MHISANKLKCMILTAALTGFSLVALANEPTEGEQRAPGFTYNGSVFSAQQGGKMQALLSYRKKDFKTAYNMFEELETHGKDAFVTFQLGYMDYLGKGTKKDLNSATRRYKLSCEMGLDLGCKAHKTLVNKMQQSL